MKIVINNRSLFKNKNDLFLNECIQQIAAHHPKHEFVFITDKQPEAELKILKNITIVLRDSSINNSILAKLWYNYKLPALAKKHKADIIINGEGIASLRTKLPQILIVQSLSFLHLPQFVLKKQVRFYKKNTQASLNKAQTILAIAGAMKKDIIERYKIKEDKIEVAHPGIKQLFKPIGWKEKEAIKEKYTEGKEYFLFTGSVDAVDNLITLVKAFSFFKKRQKSNMQLVIAVNKLPLKETFAESLKTYKYRNEVKLLDNLTDAERAKITAAAYAFVYPSYNEDAISSILEPIQCEVPVIVSDNIIFYETAADAALYVDPNKVEDIADKMMLVFKDEKKRSELIGNGQQQIKKHSWDKTAAILWNAIEKTVQR